MSVIDELGKDIKEEQVHWQNIFLNGCSDPFWADGTNLNLTRNHIINDAGKISRLTGKHYPCEIPPEVPENYMVVTGKYFAERNKDFIKRHDRLIYSKENEQINLF